MLIKFTKFKTGLRLYSLMLFVQNLQSEMQTFICARHEQPSAFASISCKTQKLLLQL